MPQDPRDLFYPERLRAAEPQYENFDLLSSQITLDLLYTYDIFHQLIARYMADYGLSKSTLNILMLLRRGPPEGMQLHDLGELLLVSRANITGLIDHLEKKGYVKRVVHRGDRRARLARITKKAEALLAEFMPIHLRNIGLLLEDLTTREKESLLTLLRKTRASLRAHANGCAT